MDLNCKFISLSLRQAPTNGGNLTNPVDFDLQDFLFPLSIVIPTSSRINSFTLICIPLQTNRACNSH